VTVQITPAQFLDKPPFAHGLHRGSAYVYYLKLFTIGRDRTVIENHKQEAGYRMVPHSMTLSDPGPHFKAVVVFKMKYVKNGAVQDTAIFTIINRNLGSHIGSVVYGVIFSDLKCNVPLTWLGPSAIAELLVLVSRLDDRILSPRILSPVICKLVEIS